MEIMNKSEMEKKLAEYLDERYSLMFLNIDAPILARNKAFYNGVCAAIVQIGSWERKENGKHIVKLGG